MKDEQSILDERGTNFEATSEPEEALDSGMSRHIANNLLLLPFDNVKDLGYKFCDHDVQKELKGVDEANLGGEDSLTSVKEAAHGFMIESVKELR